MISDFITLARSRKITVFTSSVMSRKPNSKNIALVFGVAELQLISTAGNWVLYHSLERDAVVTYFIGIPLVEATVLMYLGVFIAILVYYIPMCTVVLNLTGWGFLLTNEIKLRVITARVYVCWLGVVGIVPVQTLRLQKTTRQLTR